MRRRSTPLLIGLLAASLFAGLTHQASALTQWQKDHPWRTGDNLRINNQNQRINREVRRGEITPAQGAHEHAEEHQIRQEERDMASQNGTHLTPADQRALHQQQNALGRQIGR